MHQNFVSSWLKKDDFKTFNLTLELTGNNWMCFFPFLHGTADSDIEIFTLVLYDWYNIYEDPWKKFLVEDPKTVIISLTSV